MASISSPAARTPSKPPINGNTATVARSKYRFDGIGVVGLCIFACCLEGALIVDPKQIAFALSDSDLGYPFVHDENVSVSWRGMIAYSLAVPLAALILVDGFLRRTTGERSARRVLHYLLGLGIVILLCAILQLSLGALTPDFISRCNPSANATNLVLAGSNICQADSQTVRQGRMSFPNLIAATSIYSMMVTALYLRNHVYIPDSRIWPILLQMAPVCGGLWCGGTQYSDHRAHGVDLLAGFAVGFATFCYIQYCFFGGLKRSFKGEDSTEIAEFLLMHSKPLSALTPQQQQHVQLELAMTGIDAESTANAMMMATGGSASMGQGMHSMASPGMMLQRSGYGFAAGSSSASAGPPIGGSTLDFNSATNSNSYASGGAGAGIGADGIAGGAVRPRGNGSVEQHYHGGTVTHSQQSDGGGGGDGGYASTTPAVSQSDQPQHWPQAASPFGQLLSQQQQQQQGPSSNAVARQQHAATVTAASASASTSANGVAPRPPAAAPKANPVSAQQQQQQQRPFASPSGLQQYAVAYQQQQQPVR